MLVLKLEQLHFEKASRDKAKPPWLTLCDSEISVIIDLNKDTNNGMNKSNYWSGAIEAFPGSPTKETIVAKRKSCSSVSVMSGGSKRVSSVVFLVDSSNVPDILHSQQR